MSDTQTLAKLAESKAHRREVNVNGTKTAYWFYPSHNPKAKNLVFVHGYRGTHKGLEAIAAALDDFNIYIPDLPGFGESAPLPNTHNIENYAEWLGGFINQTHLMGSPVVSHSYGTIVTACAASQGLLGNVPIAMLNPVATPSVYQFTQQALSRIIPVSKFLGEKLGSWALGTQLVVQPMSWILAKTTDRSLRKWIHQQHKLYFSQFASRASVVEGFQSGVNTSVSTFAKDLKNPVLMVITDLDDVTPLEDEYRLAEEIPNSQYHLITGVGHLTHYEAPSLAAKFIRDFLAIQHDQK